MCVCEDTWLPLFLICADADLTLQIDKGKERLAKLMELEEQLAGEDFVQTHAFPCAPLLAAACLLLPACFCF